MDPHAQTHIYIPTYTTTTPPQTNLRLEVLHNVEELVVDLGLLAELDLHLVQVQQRVAHRQRLLLLLLCVVIGMGWAVDGKLTGLGCVWIVDRRTRGADPNVKDDRDGIIRSHGRAAPLLRPLPVCDDLTHSKRSPTHPLKPAGTTHVSGLPAATAGPAPAPLASWSSRLCALALPLQRSHGARLLASCWPDVDGPVRKGAAAAVPGCWRGCGWRVRPSRRRCNKDDRRQPAPRVLRGVRAAGPV